MNKTIKLIIIALIVVVAGAVLVFVFRGNNSNSTSNLVVNSAEDLTALVDKIYEGVTIEMPMLQTTTIETTDADMVKSFTGLDNGDNIQYLVASEPMMSSQAYSLVLVKVKEGVNASDIAKTINENIDARKWICVTAEKVYTAASGDVVCLVMSNSETAKAVYDSFKVQAGSVTKEYERTEEEAPLPEDMY